MTTQTAGPVVPTTAASPSATASATTTVPTTNPAPIPAGGAGAGTVALTAAVTAAVITAAVGLWLQRLKTRGEARERARILYAEAYQWYGQYKEFPYAVRRRRTGPPTTVEADERIRLSESMREVQAKLDYFQAWTSLEHRQVGEKYNELLSQLRRVAGGSIRAAWTEPGTSNDAGMNMPPPRVDLDALKPYENAYLQAVRDALKAKGR